MEQVSADQVKAAVVENGIRSWKLHNCSLCDYPCSFIFSADDVTFDAGCWCVTYCPAIRPSSYDDVANNLNMNKPEIRQTMWNEMLGKVAA